MLYDEGGGTLKQVAQRSCWCPITGSVQGQVGWVSLSTVGWVGLDDFWQSQHQPFCDSTFLSPSQFGLGQEEEANRYLSTAITLSAQAAGNSAM